MGFLDKVKRVFDAGGLTYDIESARTFDWDDGRLPFTLVVTGHASVDRVIERIRIEFEEDEDRLGNDDDSRRRSGPRVSDLAEGPFPIPAGETVRIDLGIDLPNASGAARMIGGAIDLLTSGSLTFGRKRYVIRVSPHVEGMKMVKGVNQRVTSESRGL